MFIVIEGMDGVGKTSVSEELSRRLEAEYIKTPPSGLNDARNIFTESGNRLAQYHFFLASVLVASERIKSLLEAGRNVVCDRYYYTTLTAYQESIKVMYPDLWKDVSHVTDHFVEPDYAFLLTADPATRRSRMSNRHQMTQDDLNSLNPCTANKQVEAYQRFELIRIETSQISIDEVVSTIIKQVGPELEV